MARVNMNANTSGFEPGIHLARISSAKEGISKKGNSQIEAKFIDAKNGKPLCQDFISLSGGGFWYGRAKLRCLGIADDFEGDIYAHELIGKLVYLKLKEDEWNGEKRLAVDVDEGEHGRGGYWSVDNPPYGRDGIGDMMEAGGTESSDDPNTPF